MSPLARSAEGLGAPVARLATAAAAVGIVALVGGLLLGQARPAVAALAASWLFFAGLSAGSVALAAAVRIAHGRWAAAVLPIAEASAGFFAPALVLLVILAIVLGAVLPPGSGAHHALAAARLIVSAAVVFAAGARSISLARAHPADPTRVRTGAVAYVLVYVVGLSVWAFDLVIRLSEGPTFTVVPPYYFMGAFLSGLAWVALVAAVRDVSGPDLRHDIGKLLFAFIIVWSYLLWALYLPTWYGDIPEEVAVLLRRWSGPWRPLTAAVLIAVFAWPFWLLFTERFKRRRGTLAVGAATILLGMWGERHLLVLPSLHLGHGIAPALVCVGVALGVAGAFLLAVGAGLGRTASGAASPGAPRT